MVRPFTVAGSGPTRRSCRQFRYSNWETSSPGGSWMSPVQSSRTSVPGITRPGGRAGPVKRMESPLTDQVSPSRLRNLASPAWMRVLLVAKARVAGWTSASWRQERMQLGSRRRVSACTTSSSLAFGVDVAASPFLRVPRRAGSVTQLSRCRSFFRKTSGISGGVGLDGLGTGPQQAMGETMSRGVLGGGPNRKGMTGRFLRRHRAGSGPPQTS